jgi:hypothetical protein
MGESAQFSGMSFELSFSFAFHGLTDYVIEEPSLLHAMRQVRRESFNTEGTERHGGRREFECDLKFEI